MPLFRALAKNMAASYFGKKAPYGFVKEVTLLQPRPRPSIFIYIFLIFSAFSHEKTGTR